MITAATIRTANERLALEESAAQTARLEEHLDGLMGQMTADERRAYELALPVLVDQIDRRFEAMLAPERGAPRNPYTRSHQVAPGVVVPAANIDLRWDYGATEQVRKAHGNEAAEVAERRMAYGGNRIMLRSALGAAIALRLQADEKDGGFGFRLAGYDGSNLTFTVYDPMSVPGAPRQ